jgi:hypothetical protein
MNQNEKKRLDRTARNLISLFMALLLLTCVSVWMNACGGDDLFFPGNIPVTATAVETATPTPA